jgi:hypothetical protein
MTGSAKQSTLFAPPEWIASSLATMIYADTIQKEGPRKRAFELTADAEAIKRSCCRP